MESFYLFIDKKMYFYKSNVIYLVECWVRVDNRKNRFGRSPELPPPGMSEGGGTKFTYKTTEAISFEKFVGFPENGRLRLLFEYRDQGLSDFRPCRCYLTAMMLIRDYSDRLTNYTRRRG